MPPPDSGAPFHIPPRGWKHPLPRPTPGGTRVLPRQRIREHHGPVPRRQVLVMQHPDPVQVLPQRTPDRLRQHRHPILSSLPSADPDFASFQVHVLDPERQTLLKSHPAAVE